MRMPLLGICTDTMCIVLSRMILDSPTDGKEGMLGTGEGFRLCVLSSAFGQCFGFKPILAQAISLLFASESCFIACFQKCHVRKRYAV